MAWTQTDIDNIEQAIAAGTLEVRYSDGRVHRYQSISDLLKARDAMKAAVTNAGGSSTIRCTYGQFSKG